MVFSLYNKHVVNYQEEELDFSKPFRRAPIAELVAEHLNLEVEPLVNISSVKQALEISLGHLVSNEAPLAICFAELSADEMNAILPFCFNEQAASENMDIAAVTKHLAKNSADIENIGIGEAIDKAFQSVPERRRRLALNLLYGVFEHEVEDKIDSTDFYY